MFAFTEEIARARPCLIVAEADAHYSIVVQRSFRRIGWDVYTARSGAELRRLARMLSPNLVILSTELPDESGWLICDKLTRELPNLWVVLVGMDVDAADHRFADTVGARALIDREDGESALFYEVPSVELTAVG